MHLFAGTSPRNQYKEVASLKRKCRIKTQTVVMTIYQMLSWIQLIYFCFFTLFLISFNATSCIKKKKIPLNGDQGWHLLIKVPIPLFASHLSLLSLECEGLGLIRSPPEIFPPSVLRHAWLLLHHDKPKYVGWDPVCWMGWTLNGLTDSLLFCFLIHYITVVSAAALLVKTPELKGEEGELPKILAPGPSAVTTKVPLLSQSQSQIL